MPEDQTSPEQIFSNQGLPYKSEQTARDAIVKKNLDPNKYKVASYEDGYVINRKVEVDAGKYYKVVFSHKQNPSDQDDVTLTVNGETLLMQRGVPVIIPGRFKECADHATYPQFTQKPNEARKQVGTVMIFPYSLMGEATEKEYQKQLADGNRKQKKALEADSKLID
jgi:deoxyribodipyrimidine photolyase